MMNFQSIEEFLQEYPCKFKATWIEDRKDKLMENMNHYRYRISRTDEKRPAMTGYFSQGYGITKQPSFETVLECLRTDAIAGELGFAEFCNEFGYDSDSRHAEAVHKACQKIHKQWIATFGELVELEDVN